MEKKHESLVQFVNKYKEETAAVLIRRKLWNEKTKELIENSFNDFINTFDLPCFVAEENALINQEAIYLAFEDEETGIVIKANNQMIIQSGGGLVYHQNANGKISATIILPYIENVKGEKEPEKKSEFSNRKALMKPLFYRIFKCFSKKYWSGNVFSGKRLVLIIDQSGMPLHLHLLWHIH